jgi:hypothetical protein
VNTTDHNCLPQCCSWCGCTIRGRDPRPGEAVSHGICASCLKGVFGGLIDTDQIIAAARAAEAESA